MSAGAVRGLALACLVGCGLLVLHGVVLGLHFEDTPRALDDAAKGKAVGYPAALGAVAALVALAAPARRAGRVALALAVLLGTGALVVDLVR